MLNKIVKEYEKKMKKKAFKDGKPTKEFERWQEKNDKFPSAKTISLTDIQKKLDKLEQRVQKLEKGVS